MPRFIDTDVRPGSFWTGTEKDCLGVGRGRFQWENGGRRERGKWSWNVKEINLIKKESIPRVYDNTVTKWDHSKYFRNDGWAKTGLHGGNTEDLNISLCSIHILWYIWYLNMCILEIMTLIVIKINATSIVFCYFGWDVFRSLPKRQASWSHLILSSEKYISGINGNSLLKSRSLAILKMKIKGWWLPCLPRSECSRQITGYTWRSIDLQGVFHLKHSFKKWRWF